jgi:Recombination endonuclease VII
VTREYYQTNKLAAIRRARDWEKKNPEKHREVIRRSRLKWRYGLTQEQINELLAKQNYACLICGDDISALKWCIDHDHKCCSGTRTCGKCFRGLLCKRCNSGLGMLKDDIETIEKAAAYLRNF